MQAVQSSTNIQKSLRGLVIGLLVCVRKFVWRELLPQGLFLMNCDETLFTWSTSSVEFDAPASFPWLQGYVSLHIHWHWCLCLLELVILSDNSSPSFSLFNECCQLDDWYISGPLSLPSTHCFSTISQTIYRQWDRELPWPSPMSSKLMVSYTYPVYNCIINLLQIRWRQVMWSCFILTPYAVHTSHSNWSAYL